MTEIEKILATEYNAQFDEIRRNRMVVSFYKYGPMKINYANGLIRAIPSLQQRLRMYEQSGNTEYLADVANFGMIEFTYPQHPNANFRTVDDGRNHIVGMGVNQMKTPG